MPVNETLPADIERRLRGLGDAIAAATTDVDFMYLFGSAATGSRTPRSDIDIAIYVADGADAFGLCLWSLFPPGGDSALVRRVRDMANQPAGFLEPSQLLS